ncbi:hypothetical protein ACFLVK_01270 [Chloroflexota bacterium]
MFIGVHKKLERASYCLNNLKTLANDGYLPDGEIEDYKIEILQPAKPPSDITVGGDIYTVNKIGLIIPWIALAIAVAAGSIYLVRRRAFVKK